MPCSQNFEDCCQLHGLNINLQSQVLNMTSIRIFEKDIGDPLFDSDSQTSPTKVLRSLGNVR